MMDGATSDIAQKLTWYCLPALSENAADWKSIFQFGGRVCVTLICAEYWPPADVEVESEADADSPPSRSCQGDRKPDSNPPLAIRFGATVNVCTTGAAAA